MTLSILLQKTKGTPQLQNFFILRKNPVLSLSILLHINLINPYLPFYSFSKNQTHMSLSILPISVMRHFPQT
jgi:hypothetical protein